MVRSEQLFLGITILQFKDSQKENRAHMSEFLCHCKKSILKFVSEENAEIKCSVLGTLGSFGLIIIWLTDQYTDVLHMVTKIRNTDIGNENSQSNKSVFLSAYTIFAQNHCQGTGWEKKIKEIKGEAALRLTLKRGISDEILAFLKEWQLDETEIYHSAGEHDIVVRMKSSDAFELFSDGNALDYKREFVKKNVLQSNLLLCEDIKESDGKEFSLHEDNLRETEEKEEKKEKEVILPELKHIQEECQHLRQQIKCCFPSTAGMADTLDWLYSDYIAKISTASNEMWADNFSHQFFTILSCLKNFLGQLDKVEIYKKDALQIINDLLSDFERQISHIAESNNLVMGTPICQFRYSGQCNLTLYSYFGIIKTILEYVYNQQEVSNQAEIVPLIVADIVPIIESKLFIELKNKNDARVITINLPMMALYEPVCYYPYLLHEIFHYVVPKDRFIRNEILGHLISIEMMDSLCKCILVQELNLKTKQEKEQLNILFKDLILPHIYSFILDYYSKYMKPIDSDNETYGEVDEKTLTADEYEKTMFDKWLSWINADGAIDIKNNPIYLYFCLLYSDKKAFCDELEKWKEKRLEKGEDFSSYVTGMNHFVESLGGIADNAVLEVQKENFLRLMSCAEEEVFEQPILLVDSIREGLVDIDMVIIGKMDFSEYLLQFTKIRKELLLKCEAGRADTQDSIRVGMVLDYLSFAGDDDFIGKLDYSKESFLDMYCGLYYHIHSEDADKAFVDKLVQEAVEWFDYWRVCVQKYLLRYRIYVVFFKALQEQSLLSENPSAGDIGGSVYWKRYMENLKEYGNNIRKYDSSCDKEQWKEKRTSINNKLFDLNIEFVHKFQYQKSFTELNQERENRIKAVSSMPYENQEYPYEKFQQPRVLCFAGKGGMRQYRWEYDICDVGEIGNLTADIAEELKKSSNMLLGKNEHPIWYRGHQSVEYKLVPSIMRKYRYQKAKQKDKDAFSLLAFMRKEYEEFRFRSDGSQETIDRVGYTEADYIALMQHYSVPSNFLDWTEDALSALYFALESFLDEKAEKVEEDAALYIFSPALYNHARKKMILRADKEDKRKILLEREVADNVQEGIPNLTVSFNQGKYDMYLLGKEEYKDDNSTPYPNVAERDKKLAFYLPVAIYIARLNKRIQAQQGIFLAYNNYTSPDVDDKFDYIALEEIQKFYLKHFAVEKETRPFLYRITIKKEARKKIADWVKAFGMSKEKCYPELSNIGERIMK